MADYLRAAEVRAMSRTDRESRLKDLKQELMYERGVAAMGGSPPSPGKIRQLRRQIARILTITREDQLGLKRGAPKSPPGAKPAPAKKSDAAPTAARKATGAKTTTREGKSGGHE